MTTATITWSGPVNFWSGLAVTYLNTVMMKYGKCSKNSNSKTLILKRKIPKNLRGLPLQNLLLPFVSLIMGENKLRVFFLCWCSKF